LSTSEADQQKECGKCTVINVTVIVQFFGFQSKFKRRLLYFKKISISAPQPLWEQWNAAKFIWKFGQHRIWLKWPDAGPASARAKIQCIPVIIMATTNMQHSTLKQQDKKADEILKNH